MMLNFKKILKIEYIILLIIVLIGVYLRFAGTFTNSFAFTYDVGRDLLAVWNIVYLHKILLIGQTTGLPGIFYGPWWYYILTPFFIIFSGNPQGIAFSMGLIGLACVVAGYYFGKKISGTFTGLLLASLISVSPELIFLSSQIWNPNIAPIFVILILLVLDRIYTEKNKAFINYLCLGILLSLSLDLEIVYGLFLCVSILLSVVLFTNRKNFFKKILSLILGFVIILSPRILFELRHQFLMTKTFSGIFTKGLESGGNITSFSSYLSIRINTILDQFSSSLASGNKSIGIIIILLVLITILLFYKNTDKRIKFFLKTSIVTIFVFFAGALIMTHDVWPHYLVGIPIFYVLILAIALQFIYKQNKIIAVIIATLVLLINLNPISLLVNASKPLWIGNAAIYRNQLKVIDYVYSQAKGGKFKYVVYTPPVNDYTYQYLFKWYGNNKYHYQPSEIANLAYFIIEPDPGFEDRPRQWFIQRENDGKIVKLQKFDSGIVVQTRIVH
jgi:hypothetical protein